MIVDAQGRRFRNLRVSLTAACNYACGYCVPNGKRLIAAQDELNGEQTIRAVELLIAAAGVEKIRITGGEPLISPKFDGFLSGVMSLPLNDVSLTTNGQFLESKVDAIVARLTSRAPSSADKTPSRSIPIEIGFLRPSISRDRTTEPSSLISNTPEGAET